MGQRLRDSLLSRLPDMALRLESTEMRLLVTTAVHAMAQGNGDDHYAIVQTEGIEVAQYGLWAKLQTSAPAKPKFVFDNHNCEYLLQKRSALTDLQQLKRWPAAAYSLLQWQKLRNYEASICQMADAVTVVSEGDRKALQEITPSIAATVVSNGIDVEEYASWACHNDRKSEDVNEAIGPTLLFTGKMDYRPNVDAVLWFGRHVFPEIVQKVPDVRFLIVGMNPHPRLDELRSNQQIRIVGAVDEIAPYIQQAAVYVIPLRVGGGTRFKALEAMAMGKAVVSTSLGVEGIPILDGQELLLADDHSSFAQATVELLADQSADGSRSTLLGENARRFVKAHYDWRQIMPLFDDLYSTLVPR